MTLVSIVIKISHQLITYQWGILQHRGLPSLEFLYRFRISANPSIPQSEISSPSSMYRTLVARLSNVSRTCVESMIMVPESRSFSRSVVIRLTELEVQAIERFIQNQNRRLRNHRTGNRHLFLIPWEYSRMRRSISSPSPAMAIPLSSSASVRTEHTNSSISLPVK